MYLIAGIGLATYVVCVVFFQKKYGTYSPSTLFLFSLGFFQVSRSIYILIPSLNHFLDSEDYTINVFSLFLSVLFFLLGHEFLFRKKKKLVAEENIPIAEDRVTFNIGKYIIFASFFPSMMLSIESMFSANLGSYGIDDGGPSPFQKISLYSSTIGLQLLNSSGCNLSRDYLLLITLVTLPRLLLSFVNMRGYLVFFILAQLCFLFITNKIDENWARKINIFFLIFIPVFIVVPLSIRGGQSINELTNDSLSLFYSFSDPSNVINLAVDNAKNIPKIIYSFSSVIAIYFPFLDLKDYYIASADNPMGEGIMVNRLDRALTKYLLWDKGVKFAGTGGNYIAELYLDLGFVGVAVGSLFLGWIVRLFVEKIQYSKMISFLSFYFFQKLIYLPRGTYTELFDMLPIYSLMFVVIMFLSNFFRDHSMDYFHNKGK